MDENVLSATVLEGDPPAESPVRLSVIIPIHNRARELRQLLAALARQSVPPEDFEVLVCNDGSTEDLSPVIEAAVRHGLRLTHLRQPRGGPGPARNLGLARARGELIAFTDSDCLPDPDWLRKVEEAFADPAVGLLGGRVDHRGAQYLSGRCVNFLMSSMLGAGGARDPRSAVHMEYYPRTCNLAVRRQLALAAGGFPATSHGEDLEFSHRIRGLGAGVRFVAEAGVVHNEKRTLRQVFREAYAKGAARVSLARRLGMHQVIHALPAGLVLYLLATACAAAAGSPLLIYLAVPGLFYALVLLALAAQGAAATRDLRAVCLVPLCAFLLHVGYGAGYLAATLRLGGYRPGAGGTWPSLLPLSPQPLAAVPEPSPPGTEPG